LYEEKKEKEMIGILIIAALLTAGFLLYTKVKAQNIPVYIENAIQTKAIEHKIDPALVKAFVKVESNFNPQAKNPADPSYGLMQITPGLAFDCGVIDSSSKNVSSYNEQRMLDVYINLDVGCKFLKKLIDKYPFDQAIQSYNVGERGYYLGRRNPIYLKKVKEAYEYFK